MADLPTPELSPTEMLVEADRLEDAGAPWELVAWHRLLGYGNSILHGGQAFCKVGGCNIIARHYSRLGLLRITPVGHRRAWTWGKNGWKHGRNREVVIPIEIREAVQAAVQRAIAAGQRQRRS